MSGVSGEDGEAVQDEIAVDDEPRRPNPFAALRSLKADDPEGSDGSGGNQH